MKTAFALYDGFSMLEFAALYDPLTRLPEGAAQWDICAQSSEVYDASGLHLYATRITPTLAGYDLVIVPGGSGAGKAAERDTLLDWLRTAAPANRLVATGAGVLLLAAAGLARGRMVAADAATADLLKACGAVPVDKAWVCDGALVTASSPAGAMALAERLYEGWLPSSSAAEAISGVVIPVSGGSGSGRHGAEGKTAPLTPPDQPNPAESLRRATVTRQTGETQVEVRVDIDGTGRRQIDTGLPFLDHMLAQIAVHGLFDLYIQAQGDLHIDPHHTVEDVGLTLGSAFQQALGSRAGIVRMASADCPMDESLAWVAVDFSGRPYSVIQAEWHGYQVGGLPVSLIEHFLESFALNARCNLHAAVRYGRDNHHQAEAIFKALARAMCAATRIDPRRAGQSPSSKGVLF